MNEPKLREIDDAELVMHCFRLCRDGGFTKGAEVLKAMQEDFPGVDDWRIRAAIGKVASGLQRGQS